MEDTQVNEIVQDSAPGQQEEVMVQEQPVATAPVCDSCGSVAELFDVPHHQPGNPHIWHYCSRCKLAHRLETAVVEKLKEIQTINPDAVDDPAFVKQVRDQLTQELMAQQ